jgi:hypothetical protein
VPEQAVQTVLDARQVAEREGDGGPAGALVGALHQGATERGERGDPLREGAVEDEQARGLEHLPLRLEAEQPLLRAVVGPEQIALGEQLGAKRLGALEVAHQQAAEHEQAEAASDPLGRDRGVPAPARERHGAGHRSRPRLGHVGPEPAREIAVGIEEPHGLDRARGLVEAPLALRWGPVMHECHRESCFPRSRGN